MKIAVFHNLPAGGAKRALFEHVRGLVHRRHQVDLYVLDTANEEYLPITSFARNVYSFPTPDAKVSKTVSRLLHHPVTSMFWRLNRRFHSEMILYDTAQARIRQLEAMETLYRSMAHDIDSQGYDVVYVHHCTNLLSPFLLRCLETPSVYYCQDTLRHIYEWLPLGRHHPDFDSSVDRIRLRKKRGELVSWQQEFLERAQEQRNMENARAATVVLANSWYSREAIVRSYGINARLCYLGVDSNFFQPNTQVERENIVVSVGALTIYKCHDFVLDAIAAIPKSNRPAMKIIGYDPSAKTFGNSQLGPTGKALLQQAIDKDVDLTISQEVSDEALREAYQRARVVAFAPYLEPFGFIPLEAAACATPVVGISEGGVRESVVNGVTGYLTSRDAQEFGDAILRLLTHVDLAETMGQNGRRFVLDQWTWERSVDTVEAIFAEVVKNQETLQ